MRKGEMEAVAPTRSPAAGMRNGVREGGTSGARHVHLGYQRSFPPWPARHRYRPDLVRRYQITRLGMPNDISRSIKAGLKRA